MNQAAIIVGILYLTYASIYLLITFFNLIARPTKESRWAWFYSSVIYLTIITAIFYLPFLSFKNGWHEIIQIFLSIIFAIVLIIMTASAIDDKTESYKNNGNLGIYKSLHAYFKGLKAHNEGIKDLKERYKKQIKWEG